ncbi:hypothetical protein LTR50_000117 [Elasticomyces elasticus]|nr:hypothetical protein LTR50_000117 [Elasticomyces elasticus]
MPDRASRSLTAGLDKLTISPSRSKTEKRKVADSWEEEAASGDDSDSEGQQRVIAPLARPAKDDYPDAPPPTPASPRQQYRSGTFAYSPFSPGDAFGSREQSDAASKRRPDKTTAVASRLIAAGLGVKAPKRTEEQAQYDRSVKEEERRKRDKAREEEARKKAESERAKAAVWQD